MTESVAGLELAPLPARRRRFPGSRGSLRDRGPVLLSFVVVLGIWEFLGRTLDLLVLPPITSILAALWTFIIDGTLAEQLTVSLITLLAGMGIAIVLGILIGLFMGLSRTVEGALDVYVNAAMAAPLIAFVPVFILLFGLGYPTRIITVIMFAIFPIIVNSFAGVRQVDPALVEMAHSFGATRRQSIREIRLPGALPYLLAGIRLGTARGVKGLINGEVLVSVVGLGGLVHRYGSAFSMDRLWALIFFIVALAVVLTRTLDYISRRVVRTR
jgi:NitT/TauT family transport system permease protein